MLEGNRIGALLLMGGEGRRFGSKLPKQFHQLAGKPVYLHTLDVFLSCPWVDEMILACHPDWVERVKCETNREKRVHVVAGGPTRQQSSFLGLKGFLQAPDAVLIHDAVRPFVTQKILEENVHGALQWGAIDTCIPSADTLVHAPGGKEIASIPIREEFLRGQTPQSFRYSLILKAHEEDLRKGESNASDDCRLILNLGHRIGVVAGDEHNIKITTELDLFLAEQLFRLRRQTARPGYDSLQGRRFAVIGGTGGIGKAICSLLEKEGALVYPLSRRTGLDLTKPSTILTAFKHLKTVDGLINCAGFLLVKPLALHSLPEIQELLEVNFTGLVIACQKAQIREGGHIINLASSSFTRGRKDYGIYSATKAAVVNFTQALAEERRDLRIHAVIPQRTRTPMRNDHFPNEELKTLLDPTNVAEAVIGLLKDPLTTGSLVEVKRMP